MNFLNPITWLRWTGQFVSAYFISIPWKEAPKSIPAIILSLALLGVSAVAFNTESNWRTQLMDSQLSKAIELEDFETVELVLRRQLKDNAGDSELNFRLALTLDELERHDEAIDLMSQLAARRDYVRAARWIVAEEYVGKSWSELDNQQRDDFGRLLKLITTEDPEDMNFRGLYADYLIASDRLTEAAKHLEILSVNEPMRGLQAAAIYRKIGRDDRSNALGEQTLRHVQKMLEENPTNTLLALAVAQTQLFAKRHVEAIETINVAVKRARNPDEVTKTRIAMGEAIVAWILHLEETSDGSLADRIDMMKKLSVAVRYAPDNARVLTLVTDKVLGSIDASHPEVVKLQRTLVDGASPGITHFILGTGGLMRGNNEIAIKHLRLAAELLPQSSAILNNLAVALLARPDEDPSQALVLTEQAISQTAPKTTPHFYETRGQVLLRMERFEDAIPDFERALSTDSLKIGAHKALAICYDKIGMPDIAEQHRESAADLEDE